MFGRGLWVKSIVDAFQTSTEIKLGPILFVQHEINAERIRPAVLVRNKQGSMAH